MSTKISKFTHVQGEDAYLMYWMQIYRCKANPTLMKKIHKNLELIVDDAGEILAYRSDLPDDMKWMVLNDGRWYINHKVRIPKSSKIKLEQLIVKLRFNACMN